MEEINELCSCEDDVIPSDSTSVKLQELIDIAISHLKPFTRSEMNMFFEELNAKLDKKKRFDSVKKSKHFRDLPQGK